MSTKSPTKLKELLPIQNPMEDEQNKDKNDYISPTVDPKMKLSATVRQSQSTSSTKNHHHKKKKLTTNTSTSTSSSRSSSSSGKNGNKHNSNNNKRLRFMNELFQGIFIYAMCISAPVILGILVKWYEHYTGRGGGIGFYGDDGYYYNDNYDGDNNSANHNNIMKTNSILRSAQDETIIINGEHNHHHHQQQQQFDSTSSGISAGATNDNNNNINNPYYDSSATSSSLLFFTEQIFYTISKLIFNSSTLISNSHYYHYNHHHFASKLMTFVSSLSRDVQFIIIATILQSIVRVILVHLLVPRYLAPKRLIAFVRNKSTHLLSSSSYVWNHDNNNNNSTMCTSNPEQQPNASLNIKFSRRESLKHYINNAWEHSGLSLRRSLGHDTKDGLSPIRRDHNHHYITSATTTISNTQSTTTLPSLPSINHLNQTQTLRLFAAPRYATAIFRLICCTISCTWALVHFRNASYWPLWVGGSMKGNTKYCWDLAGTVDPSFVWKRDFYDQYPHHNHHYQQYQHQEQQWDGLNHINKNSSSGGVGGGFDSDFDNQNSALRYFFLGQASYQLQSLCFHFLSMALLLLYGGMKKNKDNDDDTSSHHHHQRNDDDKEIISERSSFKSYLRPVFEHSMCMFITITTFFFSSLRRLGSISIFALEMSSLVLQLLQICINAPESSRLHKPHIIRFVHHYLAIPIFVYCRLFVIPFVVQYSILFESKVWLRQMDHAFLPGCGKLIYYVFNGALLLTFVMNVVYLRRLIFHPYIQSMSR
jgi:hypothetical protein